MNKAWETWGQNLSKILSPVSWFRILTPWYEVGLFHPLQALVLHRNLLLVTAVSNPVVVCLTLVAFLLTIQKYALDEFCSYLTLAVCTACLISVLNTEHIMAMKTLLGGSVLKRLNFSLDFLLVWNTNSIIHLVKVLWSGAWLEEFTFWKVEN